MSNIFDINKFNIIEDKENYYFFRALNMADNQDLENGTILDKEGKIKKIRTDRQRYEENIENGKAKYKKDDKLSLEQVYDHVKKHYRKDTNCISLSSSAKVSISYGRGFYKDKYVIIKIPKEFGSKVINAGQYMLEEIDKKIKCYVSSTKINNILSKKLNEIDNSKTIDEIKKIIEAKYTSKKEQLNTNKAKLRKGIKYKSPIKIINTNQALNKEQELEKNKIIARLILLERKGNMPPVIPYTKNNNLLVQTVENAFSSLEFIHYGNIEQEKIIDVSKEIVDIFAIIQ